MAAMVIVESLADWQQAFVKAITHPEDDYGLCSDMINPDLQHRRLDVYRNNVTYSLIEALGDLYPVVFALIGEQAFSVIARQYLVNNLPQRGTLIGYGASFSDFLASCMTRQKELATVPYLSDVARLEYALHLAFHAADDPTLQPEQVRGLDEEQLVMSQLVLHASVHLLKCSYPVQSIWQAHQQDGADWSAINLNSGDEYIMTLRDNQNQLEVRRLQLGDWLFLDATARFNTISQAAEYALTNCSDFCVSTLFQSILFDGTFSTIK